MKKFFYPLSSGTENFRILPLADFGATEEAVNSLLLEERLQPNRGPAELFLLFRGSRIRALFGILEEEDALAVTSLKVCQGFSAQELSTLLGFLTAQVFITDRKEFHLTLPLLEIFQHYQESSREAALQQLLAGSCSLLPWERELLAQSTTTPKLSSSHPDSIELIFRPW